MKPVNLAAYLEKFALKAGAFLLWPLDFLVPKKKNLWVFPACHKQHELFDNGRMLFEEAKKHPGLECVVLVKNPRHNHFCEGVRCLPIYSFTGLWAIFRSEVIVVRHGLADIQWPGISNKQHFILNLWHGIPIKGIRYTSLDCQDESWLKHETDNYSAIICSSKIDRLAMAASFNIPFKKVWNTGLPRNDLFFFAPDALPAWYQQQEQKLLKLLAGRKLVLYAPTFRENSSGYFPFQEGQLERLQHLLEQENFVLGIRGHIREFEQDHSPWHYKNIIDIGPAVITEAQIILRNTEILVTDYSSIWVDFLLRKKPVIGLCHDLAEYISKERGTLYDFKSVFPGNIFTEFNSFYVELERLILAGETPVDYQVSRMFFDFEDGQSTKRVFEKLINRIND